MKNPCKYRRTVWMFTRIFLILKILSGNLFEILYAVSRKIQRAIQRLWDIPRTAFQQIGECSEQFSVMDREIALRRVDGDQNPFLPCTAFKDKLMVCDWDIAVSSIAEGITVLPKCDQSVDEISQCIRFWRLKAWTKRIVIVRSLDTFFAPFASIINTGNSRHTE